MSGQQTLAEIRKRVNGACGIVGRSGEVAAPLTMQEATYLLDLVAAAEEVVAAAGDTEAARRYRALKEGGR